MRGQGTMRLDKALALAGYTRSRARELIAKGRVSVGERVERNAGCSVELEQVKLDGESIDAQRDIYIMLHKPAGVVTATEDSRLPTVLSLLGERERLRKPGPIGRLDRDVTGLVLLTTNGMLAHRLISPKWKAEKLYRAECEGALSGQDVQAFAQGIKLSDFTALPARLEILDSGATSHALVTLTEGKFHQVKRMFAAIGHPLIRLRRERIGCVTLDPALPEGQYRRLTQQEIDALLRMSGLIKGEVQL